MLRSKILLVSLALSPAALVLTGYSSFGDAKADECRAKPDSSAPAGMHWYYRIDRATSRHCWYLHEQGMRVHSLIESTSRQPEAENAAAAEQAPETPPVTATPQPPSAIAAEPANVDFTARWVDLPKPANLNAREVVGASNGYAAEETLGSGQAQLTPAWAGVSTVDGDVRHNAGPQTNFGSISLTGAVLLALLLVSEALIRFVRASGWSLLRRRAHSQPASYSEAPALAPDAAPDAAPDRRSRVTTDTEPREHTGVRELRGLLQRAGTGLRPPRSFAPSRPAQHHEHPSHAPAHSAFERLKSRTFSGMTWAPL
jgi:hypothetical protein